jgi:Ca2+-binding RTX toxin-like protein
VAFQSVTDVYVMEGASPYVALALASLDVAVESDSFVQIISSDALVVVDASDPGGTLGTGVMIAGSLKQADVPFIISFDDQTSAGLDVVLTLTLYHNGEATGDTTTINLHVLDNDDSNRPTDIVLTGGSIAENADAGTPVGTLSTVDPNPGDTFTYKLADTSNFVIVGNEIRVANNSHLDFETQQTQTVQVVTTDAAGHSFVKDITIGITDAPVDLDIVAGAQAQNVEENASPIEVDLKLADSSGQASITNVSGDTDFFTLESVPNNGLLNFRLLFNPQDFENPLDADHNNVYDYIITASDGTNTTTKTFHFTVTDANEAPAAVTFTNTVTSIAEDASTAAPLKVADVAVTDDALGTNVLFLYGDDADSFDLVGTELFLKAGVSLDFETKQSYSVNIDVDDEIVGNSPDLTTTFTLQVTNVSPETLNGSIDGDQLVGSGDVESIFGFTGNDILNGMGGNDVLTGGAGKDWLTGGTGADSFNFDLKTETAKGANHDVIMDFSHLEHDHIDLSDIDAKSKTKTVDDHFKFIGAKAFHHKAGELHFIKKAGFLLVEGDMDGNGKADFQIEVHGVTKLGAIDFNL